MTKVDVHTMQNVVIDHADLALYYIKEHGRNNVACYETLVADGLIREIIMQEDIEFF